MGWDFTQEEPDRRHIKREFEASWTNPTGEHMTVTDASWGSWTTLWGVLRKDGAPLCIVLWLVNVRKHEWGYKSMTEDMGPVEVNCPKRLLALVPDPGSYATAWRERVRAYHAQKDTERVRAATIQVGKYVRLVENLGGGMSGEVGKVVRFQGGTAVAEFRGGRCYRLPPRHIAEVLDRDPLEEQIEEARRHRAG